MVSRCLKTLRPRQNGRHFTDDTLKLIFLNENVKNSTNISLKFVPKGPINNIPALVEIMACRRSGDKPLCAPMAVSLLMHICVTRPQWVNSLTLPQLPPNPNRQYSRFRWLTNCCIMQTEDYGVDLLQGHRFSAEQFSACRFLIEYDNVKTLFTPKCGVFSHLGPFEVKLEKDREDIWILSRKPLILSCHAFR